MSFRDIIAEVQNLTEDEKRQLLELRERDLCNYAEEENPQYKWRESLALERAAKFTSATRLR
jgi:hypothetical protein